MASICVAPLALRDEAFHHGEVVEHVERRHLRIDAELLRQVAEAAPDVVFLLAARRDCRDGCGLRRLPAAWRWCASGSTCRRRSGRAARTCRARCRATPGAARARRSGRSWTGSRWSGAWGLGGTRYTRDLGCHTRGRPRVWTSGVTPEVDYDRPNPARYSRRRKSLAVALLVTRMAAPSYCSRVPARSAATPSSMISVR